MIYSYTQISQYLRCPRQYRYRYMDGWQEKDTRAAMVFGRCFEKALAAYFQNEDCSVALSKEWAAYKDAALEYGKNDTWDRLLQQGVHLLHMFAQGNPVRIADPSRDLQRKIVRHLPHGGEFVAFIDAIGEIDGRPHLIDWKTTSSRYLEEPEGLWSLDPQLICYSWMSGIRDVAMVVFVRKKMPEIQYLKAQISEDQINEFGRLVDATVAQIEGGLFLPHSGIRFPANGCTTCSHLGLCLKSQPLIDSSLTRRPGASDLDWLDQLAD
jgi:hypothetical protein